MDQIRTGLFLGSLDDEKAPIWQLTNRSITHVLQLCSEQPTHPDELKYLRIAVNDDLDEDIVQKLIGREEEDVNVGDPDVDIVKNLSGDKEDAVNVGDPDVDIVKKKKKKAI